MDTLLPFKIFCLENYKVKHNLTGKDALDIFYKYHVFEYITKHYNVLHSFGLIYLINDLDAYIVNHKSTDS